MLGVRLDPGLEKSLARYAKKSGQNKSSCAKQAIVEFLERRHAETWHNAQTLKAIAQIDAGDGIPAEELWAYLDTFEKSKDE